MLYKIVDIVPYKCVVYFTIGKPSEVEKFLVWKKCPYAHDLKLDDDKYSSLACTFTKAGHVVIYAKEIPQNSVMVHEALHAIMYVLYRAGIELSRDSEEAFCYHLEHLVKEYDRLPFKSKKFD